MLGWMDLVKRFKMQQLTRRCSGHAFTIYQIAECVGQAYLKAMKPVNIISAFKKCGIFPFDESVFTEEDFLPIAVTDLHLLFFWIYKQEVLRFHLVL